MITICLIIRPITVFSLERHWQNLWHFIRASKHLTFSFWTFAVILKAVKACKHTMKACFKAREQTLTAKQKSTWESSSLCVAVCGWSKNCWLSIHLSLSVVWKCPLTLCLEGLNRVSLQRTRQRRKDIHFLFTWDPGVNCLYDFKDGSAASRSHSRGNWGREGLFDISSIYSLFKHYTEDTLFVQCFPRNPVVIWDRWPFVWTHWSILSFRLLSVATGPLWAVVYVVSLFHLNIQFDWGKHNCEIFWINHISHLFLISYTDFVTESIEHQWRLTVCEESVHH